MKHTKIYPLLLGFFVMGFVDIVGIATNYVKVDFHLSDAIANLLPLMVFIWFALFSIPTGALMNKYGKRNVVIFSLLITLIAMLIPILFYSFAMSLVAFALLGIGNTIIQVSLNPMTAETVDKPFVLSTLTWGQFFKSISSFLGPILVGTSAAYLGDWKYVFIAYSMVTLLCMIWIKASINNTFTATPVVSPAKTFALLANKTLLRLFVGILMIVGLDVGLNTTIPRYLIEHCHILLDSAALGTSVYFAAKITGTLIGAILLTKVRGDRMLRYCMITAFAAFTCLLLTNRIECLLVFIFIIGLACANVFSIIYASAIQYMPHKDNEVSALMIMAVSGGALISPLMGFIADISNQTLSMAILLICIIYLFFISFKLE